MTYVPLFQEELKSRPFWMLVACSMVNLTHWRQAKPVFDRLYQRCGGDVVDLTDIPDTELVEILRPLGLQNRRTRHLREMAETWILMMCEIVEGVRESEVTRHDIMKMPGCGTYASDSWAIFMENDLTVVPKDGRLQEYLDHVGGN